MKAWSARCASGPGSWKRCWRPGRAIAATIDYDDVLRRVARAAGEALGTAECVIWEYPPRGDLAVFRCLWERDPVPGRGRRPRRRQLPVTTHAGGLDGAARRRRRPAVALRPRPPADGRRRTWTGGARRRGSRSRWCSADELLGVMILIETSASAASTPDEVRMAGVIGEQAAVALAQRPPAPPGGGAQPLAAVAGGAAAPSPTAQTATRLLSEVARLAAEAVQSPAAFIYEYDATVTRSSRARATGPQARRSDAIGAVFPLSETPDDRRALGPGRGVRGDPLRPGALRRGAPAHGGVRRADAAQRAAPLSRRDARPARADRDRGASASSPTTSSTSGAPSASR